METLSWSGANASYRPVYYSVCTGKDGHFEVLSYLLQLTDYSLTDNRLKKKSFRLFHFFCCCLILKQYQTVQAVSMKTSDVCDTFLLSYLITIIPVRNSLY